MRHETMKRFRHVSRGSEYDLIGTAELQDAAGDGVNEGDLLAIYRGDDGKLWVRRWLEFGDGRFERIDTTSRISPLAAVLAEVAKAVTKFPTWPTDPFHAMAVLGEKYGELQKAVVQATYEPGKATIEDARGEAIQAAAMALRFLASFDNYDFTPGVQHNQPASAVTGA